MKAHIGTTWQIRFNLCFLWPTRVHNPKDKSIGSAVFAQFTAESPYTLQWDALPPSKLPSPMGDLHPHLIHGSLGPPESLTKQHLDRFSRLCRAH